MDYTKLTLPELANGIIQTERAIRRCKEILDDLRQPKTVGLKAVAEATRGLLPRLEQDLKAPGESLHRQAQVIHGLRRKLVNIRKEQVQSILSEMCASKMLTWIWSGEIQ